MTKKVTFTLSQHIAHNSSGGQVLGDFNDWNTQTGTPLTRDENGDLTATLELETGRTYQYRYLLHDGRWLNDDRAHFYMNAEGMFVENCVVVVEEDITPVIDNSAPETEASEIAATEDATSTPANAKPKAGKKVASKKDAPAKKETAAKKEAAQKKVGKPAAGKAANADHDLTKIEGIGPQISELLKKEGINTFSKLSKTSIVKLKDLLNAAGSHFNVHQPDSWPKQAKLAAAEKWDELASLQKELNAGK